MMKVITKEEKNETIHIQDILFLEHYIAFSRKKDFGYLVLNNNGSTARLVAVNSGNSGSPCQGFKLYERHNPIESIQILICAGYEIFAFTSRKEFYKFLAEHTED